ncbi:Aspartyl-tRNA(Asn)/glutamyl-tRNA(Gln) amidotransferase subunit A OS=Castellaniella defragrans OX=75697 GN=HNR28_003073 PE=3 SV=1 [Castellaniella defragrans]
MEPCFLSATEAASAIKAGQLSIEELTRSCLARIEEREPIVRAWLHLDPELAIRHARDLDNQQMDTPVYGLPVGIKDVMDTLDMPTTHNSPIYRNAWVGRDAACVAVMRHSGAVILGKTDTVEFAAGGRLAQTTNPHNPAHTPGGSSSGSAAAVADGMVPIALGTQTAGSIIRPASFTGTYGMKPTHGVVSREGVRMSSPSLDTVGWFGRSADDLCLVARAFRLMEASQTTRPKLAELKIGLCRTALWQQAEPAAQTTLEKVAHCLEAAGARVFELECPNEFTELTNAQLLIEHSEGRASFLPEYLGAYTLLAPDLRERVDNQAHLASSGLVESYRLAERCRLQFDILFGDSMDAILTLACGGEAPRGLNTTGDPLFNRAWSLLHAPCICLPASYGPRGLPIGVQLVGARFFDHKLLSIARLIDPIVKHQ